MQIITSTSVKPLSAAGRSIVVEALIVRAAARPGRSSRPRSSDRELASPFVMTIEAATPEVRRPDVLNSRSVNAPNVMSSSSWRTRPTALSSASTTWNCATSGKSNFTRRIMLRPTACSRAVRMTPATCWLVEITSYRSRPALTVGAVMAPRTPTTATTSNASINVKPAELRIRSCALTTRLVPTRSCSKQRVFAIARGVLLQFGTPALQI